MVFTDGSCRNRKVGTAASQFINHEHIATLCYHLGKSAEHTVFEAEAVGLILAAQLLLSNEEVSFPATIFADNQAVIRSCTKPTAKPGHYLLIHFRKLIRHILAQNNATRSQVSLNWIAGHSDILGNELADREANIAASNANNTSPENTLPPSLCKSLPSSISATKQFHEASLQSLWRVAWRKSPRYDHINSIDPTTPSRTFMKINKNLGKKHTTIYTQLHTGHIPLNKHLHHFKCCDTPLCLQCANNCPETVHHFLFNCPKYARERHKLWIKLGQKVLSIGHLLASKHTQQSLFNFINKTQCSKLYLVTSRSPRRNQLKHSFCSRSRTPHTPRTPGSTHQTSTKTHMTNKSTVPLPIYEPSLMPSPSRPMPRYMPKNPINPPQHTHCRACSTAERTATNIVLAPIARAHCAAPAPLLLTLLLPAPVLLLLHAPAPCSCAPAPAPALMLLHSCSCAPHTPALLTLLCSSRSCAPPAPFARCSL